LIADGLLAPDDERLLPAVTKAKTSRQKFQRSFAQEFLCPFDALMEKLGAPSAENPPEEDDIDDAAQYFNVSTRVIETTLANHGILPPF
jgi:Zn-dependent peptidase ImmA (M78 family)